MPPGQVHHCIYFNNRFNKDPKTLSFAEFSDDSRYADVHIPQWEFQSRYDWAPVERYRSAQLNAVRLLALAHASPRTGQSRRNKEMKT